MADDPEATRLREVLARYVSSAEATILLERALNQAALDAPPRDRGRYSSFVEGYVAPLLVTRLPPALRVEAREALRRLTATVMRVSVRPPSTSPPPTDFRDGIATLEVAMRRFADIVVVGSDAMLDAALRPFGELGSRLVRVGTPTEVDLSATVGTLLVVLDARSTPPAIDELFERLAARVPKKTTLIVLGEPGVAERARSRGLAPVVLLPKGVTADQLRAVVRLGPS